MGSYSIIKGGDFADHRGSLKFFNSLNMSTIVRMYEIKPIDKTSIRAWQGHKEEHKWFYCTNGIFIINLVAIENFEKPSKKLIPKKIILDAGKPEILQITGGYASGIKAMTDEAQLLVFSNFTTEQSKNDDYRFSTDFWKVDWNS